MLKSPFILQYEGNLVNFYNSLYRALKYKLSIILLCVSQYVLTVIHRLGAKSWKPVTSEFLEHILAVTVQQFEINDLLVGLQQLW
jgi:hypothetical protein